MVVDLWAIAIVYLDTGYGCIRNRNSYGSDYDQSVEIMRRIAILGSLCVVIVLGFFVSLAERNFDNPTDSSLIPVGYWKVSDIQTILNTDSENSDISSVQIRISAENVALDYVDNGAFQMFMVGLSSFSTLKEVGFGKELFFSHQGDLFERWDDIYVGGSKALLRATDRDTGVQQVIPLVIYSPDFDTGSGDLVFYARSLHNDESAEKLFDLYGRTVPPTNLKLFESVDLVTAELFVEPFATNFNK